MHLFTRRRAGTLLAPAILALLIALPNVYGTGTRAGHADVATNLTLSVYTCCGSLAGFNDTNPTHLSSMRHIYGSIWSQAFPGLRWNETAFNDPATLDTRLAAAVKSGDAPDLVFIQNAIGDTVLRGLAQPLDRYFAAAHTTDSAFLPGMARWAHFGGHWWAIPAVSGPLGGQHIFLPRYMTPLGFNSGNLRTFDDYYRMSQKAVRFDASGNLTRIGYWPGVGSWETIGTLICPPGHGLYDMGDRPTATDPCNLAYMKYLLKLQDLYGGAVKLNAFLAHDPDFVGGDARSYLVTGRALIPSSGLAYWNLPPLDTFGFGTRDGVGYALTTMPITVHGTLAEAANYPSTQQEVVIPPGARHPDAAFAVSTALFWGHGALLGRAASGSPMVKDSGSRWLNELYSGESATRKQAGLPGNPIATLEGVKLQPTLGLLSNASNPINPVDPYYQQQLLAATTAVLSNELTPEAALQGVQQRVLAEQTRLRATYGAWNW